MKISVFFLVILLNGMMGYAQSREIDSLRRAVTKSRTPGERSITLSYLSMKYLENDKDSARAIANRALEMANRSQSPEALASAWNTKGWIIFKDGEYDKALNLISKAAHYYRTQKSYDQLYKCHYNMATIYLEMGKSDKALENLVTALDILEKQHDPAALTLTLKAIGNLYRDEKKYAEAKNYLERANKTAPDDASRIEVKTALGNLALVQHDADKAMKYYEAALILAQKTNDTYSTAIVEENIGRVFVLKKDFDAVEVHYLRSLNLMKGLGHQVDVINGMLNMGQVYVWKEDFARATKAYEDALSLASKIGNQRLKLSAIRMLMTVNLGFPQGTWENVVNYQQWYYELRDTLNLQEQTLRLDELRTKFESDQKDKEIKLLNKDKLVQEQKTKLNRSLAISLALAIVAILVSVAFVVNRNKLKQRNKELELRNRIAADLHDDVGSSLSSIRLLGEMVRQQPEASPALLEKMGENIRETLESMGDIVWMIKPEADKDSRALARRMEKFAADITASSGIRCVFRSENPEAFALSMLQKRNVYLIFKEALNNAIKYAEASEINVSLRFTGKRLLLEVTDDGKGFDTQSVRAGNGLDNMAQRAADIGASYELTSVSGKGTTVRVTLDL